MSLSSHDGLEIHFQIIWNATRMILQKKKGMPREVFLNLMLL